MRRVHHFIPSITSILSLLALVVAVGTLQSCEVLKPVRQDRHSKVHRPKKRTPKPIHRKSVRVITPKYELKKDSPVITDHLAPDPGYPYKTTYKSKYRIAVLLPFRAAQILRENQANRQPYISPSSERFIHFWLGAKLAAQDLQSMGMPIEVHAFDTKFDEAYLPQLWERIRQLHPDAIIGPYKRNSMRYLSQKARQQRILLLSPWIASAKMTQSNPFYVQLRPHLDFQYETVLRHMLQECDTNRTAIFLLEDDINKQKHFEKLINNLTGGKKSLPIKVVLLNRDTVLHGSTLLGDKEELIEWFADTAHCLFFPYTLAKDQLLVFSFLQKLSLLPNSKAHTIYGMYRWLDYNDEVRDLLNVHHVRIPVFRLVDPFDERVRTFRQRFLQEYGFMPLPDAYEGYDIMRFVGQSLHKHGTFPQIQWMQDKRFQGIGQTFLIHPIYTNNDPKVDFFENQHIEFVELHDHQFVRRR